VTVRFISLTCLTNLQTPQEKGSPSIRRTSSRPRTTHDAMSVVQSNTRFVNPDSLPPKPIYVLRGHIAEITCLRFIRNNTRLVSGYHAKLGQVLKAVTPMAGLCCGTWPRDDRPRYGRHMMQVSSVSAIGAAASSSRNGKSSPAADE
jgi:hypothetical protein